MLFLWWSDHTLAFVWHIVGASTGALSSASPHFVGLNSWYSLLHFSISRPLYFDTSNHQCLCKSTHLSTRYFHMLTMPSASVLHTTVFKHCWIGWYLISRMTRYLTIPLASLSFLILNLKYTPKPPLTWSQKISKSSLIPTMWLPWMLSMWFCLVQHIDSNWRPFADGLRPMRKMMNT